MKYQYETCCVNARGQDINKMTDQARDITFRTFCRHCAGWKEWAVAKGYYGDSGLSLGKDWAVSFHKSRYRGKPCYYVRWSAIEFIWT